ATYRRAALGGKLRLCRTFLHIRARITPSDRRQLPPVRGQGRRMMKKRLAEICLCSLCLVAYDATAECVRPEPTFKVPDGKTANDEQMATAQRDGVGCADASAEYARCLEGGRE